MWLAITAVVFLVAGVIFAVIYINYSRVYNKLRDDIVKSSNESIVKWNSEYPEHKFRFVDKDPEMFIISDRQQRTYWYGKLPSFGNYLSSGFSFKYSEYEYRNVNSDVNILPPENITPRERVISYNVFYPDLVNIGR